MRVQIQVQIVRIPLKVALLEAVQIPHFVREVPLLVPLVVGFFCLFLLPWWFSEEVQIPPVALLEVVQIQVPVERLLLLEAVQIPLCGLPVQILHVEAVLEWLLVHEKVPIPHFVLFMRRIIF